MAGNETSVQDVAARMAAIFEDGEPAVIRGLGGLFSTRQVFDWIRLAHPSRREKVSLQKIRALKTVWRIAPPTPPDPGAADPGRPAEMYRDGGMIMDPTPFLPGPEHADFEAWVAATRGALGGDFGLQAPGLECASWDALHRLQGLLGPTLAQTGPRPYRFNAFAGDYRRTPFGFHVDPHHEGVFQLVLHGRRQGRFWEGLVLGDDDASWIEDSNDRFAPPREPDVVFDLEPGDLVFWPGTHVHGFDTHGPSLALSIVIDRASPRDRAQVIADLEVRSGAGKSALPPVDTRAQVQPADPVRRRATFPLVYERHDDELIVGICGRTFEWPDRLSVPAAMALLDHLIANPDTTAQTVMEACAHDTLAPNEILGALSMLKGFGYLV